MSGTGQVPNAWNCRTPGGLCRDYIAWDCSPHNCLESRTNPLGGCAPDVTRNPETGLSAMAAGFSAGRESNRSRCMGFCRLTINNGSPTHSIHCSMPSPSSAQHKTTQLVPVSTSISQWLARQAWTRRTAIVLFEGGDLGTIDPRPSCSNSAAPGTRVWVILIPPTGILTRLIDR